MGSVRVGKRESRQEHSRNRKRNRKEIGFVLLMIASILLTACGQQNGQKKGITVLTLAIFEENPEVSKQVALFNQNNTSYSIEIRQYERSDQPEEDGCARLQREILSGKGPDLIDYGSQYASSDVVGGYTENLLPWLETGAEESKGEYFTNILEAFSYNGNLYAMPVSFTLQTFAGSKQMLGGLEQWNIQEMISCYEGKKEEMILYPGETKTDVFGTILTGSMDYYIDWNGGTCSFDGDEFRKVLEFANRFPEYLEMAEDFSVKQTFLEGKALLLPLRLATPFDICRAEYIFGASDLSYIGFPVEGSCGTVVTSTGPMLAMSAASEHKEAAWEFIRQFLGRQYQEEIASGFPVSRSVLEEKLTQYGEVEYTVEDGNQKPVSKEKIFFEGEEPVDIYSITKEQADILMNLIASVTISIANDYQLYNILLEEAGSYFAGDKTLEEAAGMIQSRASIFVSERVKVME